MISLLQHNLGVSTCDISDQCKNLYSRNSNGEYYIRGGESGYRLEKAVSKGVIAVSPFGYETEHLVSVTKQKISLVSVQPLDSNVPHMRQSEGHLEDAMYEMVLPYKKVFTKWAVPGTMVSVR